MNPLASELLTRMKRQNRSLSDAERALKRTELASVPPQIQIEPTNRCNLRCSTCARTYYDPALNPPSDFPEELFEALEPAFAFAESVLFGGYGEPLMGATFPELFHLASDYGCSTELITNGSLLDSGTIEMLCEGELSRIRFSVDAASDVEMMRLRGVSLSDILESVDLIREIGGMNAPRMAFNFTLNINNLEHLKPLISLAASRDVAEIFVAHQQIYSESQVADSVFHHPAHTLRVFEEIEEFARSQRVFLSLPPVSGETVCLQPFELLMIAADARVQGCCSALFNNGRPKLELGSLWESSLLDLWNHDRMKSARAAAYGDGPWPEACAGCGLRVFTLDAHLRLLDEGNRK